MCELLRMKVPQATAAALLYTALILSKWQDLFCLQYCLNAVLSGEGAEVVNFAVPVKLLHCL